MNLVDLRLGPADEADLRWFWSESDGDLGLKSMFPQQMAQLQLGAGNRGTWTPKRTEPDGRLLAAAARARRVSRALESLRREHVTTLRVVYGSEPDGRLQSFGELAPLVLATHAARTAHRRSRTTRAMADWLSRLARRAERGESDPRLVVAKVRTEAEGRLSAASRAYRDARWQRRRRG